MNLYHKFIKKMFITEEKQPRYTKKHVLIYTLLLVLF